MVGPWWVSLDQQSEGKDGELVNMQAQMHSLTMGGNVRARVYLEPLMF